MSSARWQCGSGGRRAMVPWTALRGTILDCRLESRAMVQGSAAATISSVSPGRMMP
jgi:hypothetical protein